MNRLFVKICGITRPQDADLAAELGARALGFILWPGSPRYIAPEAARAVAARVPPHVMKVGVFVDEPLERVARIADEIGLDAVQLHGRETPDDCRQLAVRLKPDPTRGGTSAVGSTSPVGSGLSRTIIKSVALISDAAVDISEFDPDVLLLVDAHDPARHGGTGRAANWDAARELAAVRPTILAGGLNPGNVALAVRSVHPYGVDVSSGVESEPGVKDPNRLRSFFEALHG